MSLEKLAARYEHLRGIPASSYYEATPRFLIGVNNLSVMLPLRVREGLRQEPVAAKTRLGWCIYGGEGSDCQPLSFNCHYCGCNGELDSNVHNTVKSYFALEDSGAKSEVINYSKDEERALCILEQTTVRIGNRFETGPLWRTEHVEFPVSYSMALKRLECLENRMSRNPSLRDNLQKQLTEYESKGYAHRATPEELVQADPRRV